MIVVTGGRRSGKTTTVIRWFLEAPGQRAILVVDESRRKHILRSLRESAPHIDPNQFGKYIITAETYYGQLGHRGHWPWTQIAIDDAEDVLYKLLGANVEFMAMTATWIPIGPVPTVKAEVIQDNQIQGHFDREPGEPAPHRPARRIGNVQVEINSRDVADE